MLAMVRHPCLDWAQRHGWAHSAWTMLPTDTGACIAWAWKLGPKTSLRVHRCRSIVQPSRSIIPNGGERWNVSETPQGINGHGNPDTAAAVPLSQGCLDLMAHAPSMETGPARNGGALACQGSHKWTISTNHIPAIGGIVLQHGTSLCKVFLVR